MAEGGVPPLPSRADEAGSALVLVLLALLGLQLLAHGVLLLALQERLASATALQVVQARAAAEAAALRGVGPLPEGAAAVAPLGTLVVSAGRVGPRAAVSDLVRLDREVWMVRGEGWAQGAAWSARAGVVAWALDPATRAAEDLRPLLAGWPGPAPPPGRVASAPFSASEAPGWCLPWAPALDSLAPPPPVAAVGVVETGRAWPRVGRLAVDDLLDGLPAGGGGVMRPRPVTVAGACVPGPLNWGDPLDPTGPCGGRQVTLGVDGDVDLVDGRGQGVLVVRGAVTLEAVVFHGLLVAGGDVRLGPGASVVGQVRAGGVISVHPDASAVGAPCPVARALASASGLRGLRPLSAGGPLLLP